MKNNRPVHFLVLKIIGVIGIIVAIVGFVLSILGFGKNSNFIIGGVLVCVGFFVGAVCLLFGFTPEIAKLKTKTAKYIQNDNKEDLTDIANTTADITSEAITKVAKSIREETMFCKHCGEKIDANSKFCKHCGKEQ